MMLVLLFLTICAAKPGRIRSVAGVDVEIWVYESPPSLCSAEIPGGVSKGDLVNVDPQDDGTCILLRDST